LHSNNVIVKFIPVFYTKSDSGIYRSNKIYRFVKQIEAYKCLHFMFDFLT